MHYEPYAQRTLAKLRSANELYAKWMLRKLYKPKSIFERPRRMVGNR